MMAAVGAGIPGHFVRNAPARYGLTICEMRQYSRTPDQTFTLQCVMRTARRSIFMRLQS
jgi:hypothetical protein